MDCGRFDKLIDSYLDGQLSGSLLAEFHAHRLACQRCSRVVSMLQAAGDVIAHDRCEPKIGVDFADRILAGLPAVAQKANRSLWMVRLTAGAASLTAAAAIVMAVMLSRQAPTHRPDTAVAGGQAVSDGSGLKVPRNVASIHHEVLTHSGLVPSDGDLLTGNAIRGAVDRVVGWTEYKLTGNAKVD